MPDPRRASSRFPTPDGNRVTYRSRVTGNDGNRVTRIDRNRVTGNDRNRVTYRSRVTGNSHAG